MLQRETLLGQSYYFRHYQVEHGLSNNTVTCSLQDRTGFLWFGTKDGLNRFDGYTFKTFRKTAGKPGIGNNYIHTLYEDKEGTLWAGTEKGLYQYLKTSEEFRQVSALADRYIDKITEDSHGNFWFISGFALCRYEKKSGHLQYYDHREFFIATSLCTTADGTLWVGTADGQLKRYHPQTNTFSGFDLFQHSNAKANRWIECLYSTTDGYLLAGTSHTEIKTIDPYRLTYMDITLPNSGQADLFIRSILQTNRDEFWLGTESGVFVYNMKTGSCLHLKKDYNNPFSINDNAIYTFCRDREGGIWAGTYFGGLNYLPNQQTPFAKYYPKKDENSLSGNVVRELKKDQYGNIWIGTEDAGISKLNPATGQFTRFLPDGTKGGLSFFNIHGLLATKDELWIGTFQHGLDIMDIRTGKVVRHFDAGPQSGLPHNFIYCIYQTVSGEIWIGSPLGITSYNRAKNNFERLEGLPMWDFYTAVLEDQKGGIWAGTFGKGVHYYNRRTGKGETFTYNAKDSNSLGSDRVNAVFEDSQHTLWFATEEGLCKWNERTDNFTRYGTANGFPSDFILSILEDNERNLWVSTTKGLVRFQPSSGKLDVYTTANGLLSDQFNYSSAFKNADGRLYFGSVKGLVSFRPDEFSRGSYTAPVYLTAFQVNGKDAAIDSSGSLLKKSIVYTDNITLNHNQSTITIDFAALNFSAPETVQYAYQMAGLSKNWITLNRNRRVDFIGLAPGTYTFGVKALLSNSNWSKETKLTITILPSWWVSQWARIGYVTLALLLVLWIVRYYHRRMEERNRRKIALLKVAKEKEMLEMELANEKELLEAKLEFFTNVAHEIKTPLTLIKVPLKKVLKKAGHIPEIENSLKIMDRNTDRLIELTGQLLDFRQTEMDKFQLSFEQVQVSELVAEACSGFTSLAEQNNISFSLRLPATPFVASVDEDAFHKIIYNLFSNAVKYASTNVRIALLPQSRSNDTFTIIVKNDGYLIRDELKEKIFEPFYRIPETGMQAGTGIGLALARSLTSLHNGTLELEPTEDNMNVFSLTLPILHETHHAFQNRVNPDRSAEENFQQ